MSRIKLTILVRKKLALIGLHKVFRNSLEFFSIKWKIYENRKTFLGSQETGDPDEEPGDPDLGDFELFGVFNFPDLGLFVLPLLGVDVFGDFDFPVFADFGVPEPDFPVLPEPE